MINSDSLIFILFFALIISFASCKPTEKSEETHQKEFNLEDTEKVQAAILDYVEALYLVDSTRIDKSVDLKLRKVGYYFNPDTKEYIDNLEMTHNQLSNLAASWNSEFEQGNQNSPKEIEIFDVNSKTASAKLTVEWGIDLFHLAKVNNQWKIVNVMWQSMPDEE
ncbi:MAG: nuclear transport factor 2 family protein [Polaribacter sp.]|uniref:nuclear transport factor 2 family protein n=1 Tax=Polaribacter sp. TaxID=1920175 RepID=UPI003BB11F0A